MNHLLQKTSNHFFNSYEDDILHNLTPYNTKFEREYVMAGMTPFLDFLKNGKLHLVGIIILAVIAVFTNTNSNYNPNSTNPETPIVDLTEEAKKKDDTIVIQEQDLELATQEVLESITVESKDRVDVINNTNSALKAELEQVLLELKQAKKAATIIPPTPATVVVSRPNPHEVQIAYNKGSPSLLVEGSEENRTEATEVEPSRDTDKPSSSNKVEGNNDTHVVTKVVQPKKLSDESFKALEQVATIVDREVSKLPTLNQGE